MRECLLHSAVEFSDSGMSERRWHSAQQVYHPAVGGAEADEHVYDLGIVQRGQRAQRMRDGFGRELADELVSESLVADGRAQQLKPIAEALHLLGEGVRGVIPEEHGLVLD